MCRYVMNCLLDGLSTKWDRHRIIMVIGSFTRQLNRVRRIRSGHSTFIIKSKFRVKILSWPSSCAPFGWKSFYPFRSSFLFCLDGN